MSTGTHTDTGTSTGTPAARPTARAPRGPGGGGLRGLVAGQWVAVRSLRTTWWVLGGASLAMVLLALLFTATAESGGEAGPPGLDTADPVGLSLGGYDLAALAVGVLGVLLVTGEYTSGAVRVTFAAVPRRWPVLLARSGVLTALALATTTVAALAAFLVGQAALGDTGVSLGDDGVARAVLGAALYVTAIGVMGSALGWLLRSTGGAIGTLFGIVFLLPVLGALLPASWGPDVVRWLPGQAGSSIVQVVTDAGEFAPWTGFGVLCAYLAVLLGAAVAAVRRRDA